MDNVVNKIKLVVKFTLVLFVVSILLLGFSSCFLNNLSISIEKKIEKSTNKWMECIIDRNTSELLKYFCSEIQDTYKNTMTKKIEKLFNFIDGNIISYNYDRIHNISKSKSDGKINYYSGQPTCLNVTTDTGHKYTIIFDYEYIDNEHPNYEGLNSIRVTDNDNPDNYCNIGKIYYSSGRIEIF